MKGLILVPVLMFVLVGSVYAADTLVVRPDPGPGEYSSVGTACLAAQDGDTVLVYPGEYKEQDVFITQNNLTLKSTDGPHSTIIRGWWPTTVVFFGADGCTLDGFTILNDYFIDVGLYGVDIYGGSNTITNNIISGCQDGITEWPILSDINSVITNNVFSLINGFCILEEAVFFYDINSVIANNTFANYEHTAILMNAGMYLDPHHHHLNSTIANNVMYNTSTAKWVYGIELYETSSESRCAPTIKNNIIADFKTDIHRQLVDPVVWDSACIRDANIPNPYYVIEPNNIFNEDPLLIGDVLGEYDYHLKFGSPAMEAGANDVPGLPGTDADGNPRIFDADIDGEAVVDMGAYEFGAGPPLPIPETLTLIGELNVPRGIVKSLLVKLQNAAAIVDKAISAVRSGKSNAAELVNAAINMLDALRNEVGAMLRAGQITSEEGEMLLEGVDRIRGYLVDISPGL
jgi:hypothetical protein